MNWRVSSCCCFSLRTGTLILGYFGLIGGIIGSIGCIAILSNVREWLKDAQSNATNKMTPEQFDTFVTVTKVIVSLLLVLLLIHSLLSILLLMGVYKEKPGLIKFCVILSVIACVILALGCLGRLIDAFKDATLFGYFVSSLLGLALNVYFTMVIHSYRLELLEGGVSKRDGPNLPRQF